MADKIRCVECGKVMEGDDEVGICLDNWLQWNHYCDIGKYAGVYCSPECFCRYWSVTFYDSVGQFFEEVI